MTRTAFGKCSFFHINQIPTGKKIIKKRIVQNLLFKIQPPKKYDITAEIIAHQSIFIGRLLSKNKIIWLIIANQIIL